MQPPGGTKQIPPEQFALVAQAVPVLVQTPAVAAARVVTMPARTPPGAAWVRTRAVAMDAPAPPGPHIPASSAMATLKVWSTRSSVSPSPFRSSPWSASKVRKVTRSEEHTSELQSHVNLVCRLLLEKKNKNDLGTHHRRHRLRDTVAELYVSARAVVA